MTFWEKSPLFISLLLYVCSMILILRRSEKTEKAGLGILIAGWLLQLFSAIVRWKDIGHPPIFGTYEATMLGSWILTLFIAISFFLDRVHFRLTVLTALPLVIAHLLYGLSHSTDRVPLTISELSLWVDFHALFSWLAYAPLTLAFCLSTVYLLKGRLHQGAENSGEKRADQAVHQADQADQSDDLELLDQQIWRYMNLGFIAYTVMFALGCYHSASVNGEWWQWDPVETTSLATWLLIGLYIHLRIFYNWNGGKSARLAVVIFLTMIVAYWSLTYLPAGSTFHVFDLKNKMHAPF